MSDYKIEEVFNKIKLLAPKRKDSSTFICGPIRVELESRIYSYSGDEYFVSVVYKDDIELFEMSNELFDRLASYSSKILSNDDKIDNFLETF